jgi:hypothetical protein
MRHRREVMRARRQRGRPRSRRRPLPEAERRFAYFHLRVIPTLETTSKHSQASPSASPILPTYSTNLKSAHVLKNGCFWLPALYPSWALFCGETDGCTPLIVGEKNNPVLNSRMQLKAAAMTLLKASL